MLTVEHKGIGTTYTRINPFFGSAIWRFGSGGSDADWRMTVYKNGSKIETISGSFSESNYTIFQIRFGQGAEAVSKDPTKPVVYLDLTEAQYSGVEDTIKVEFWAAGQLGLGVGAQAQPFDTSTLEVTNGGTEVLGRAKFTLEGNAAFLAEEL